jgi:hypothetical protein
MTHIPALSIRQPWAELVMAGKKDIELRSWNTDYRGEMWIHAGLKMNLAACQYYGLDGLFTGGYIGWVVLAAIVPLDADRWVAWRSLHLDPGPYRPGLFAWFCSSPLRFVHPIPGAGKQDLFYPPAEICSSLEEEARESSSRR